MSAEQHAEYEVGIPAEQTPLTLIEGGRASAESILNRKHTAVVSIYGEDFQEETGWLDDDGAISLLNQAAGFYLQRIVGESHKRRAREKLDMLASYLAGVSTTEIAATRGITPTSVRAARTRAYNGMAAAVQLEIAAKRTVATPETIFDERMRVARAYAAQYEGKEGVSWKLAALCGALDPEQFYRRLVAESKLAKQVCLSCAVRSECLDEALVGGEDHGVWGGQTARERRATQRKRSPNRMLT